MLPGKLVWLFTAFRPCPWCHPARGGGKAPLGFLLEAARNRAQGPYCVVDWDSLALSYCLQPRLFEHWHKGTRRNHKQLEPKKTKTSPGHQSSVILVCFNQVGQCTRIRYVLSINFWLPKEDCSDFAWDHGWMILLNDVGHLLDISLFHIIPKVIAVFLPARCKTNSIRPSPLKVWCSKGHVWGPFHSIS